MSENQDIAKNPDDDDRSAEFDEADREASNKGRWRQNITRRQMIASAAVAAGMAGLPSSDAEAQADARHAAFYPSDVAVLRKVIAKVPHLPSVAAVVKFSRYIQVTYPVLDSTGIEALFRRFGGRRLTFGGHQVSLASARQFFPDVYFPIQSEDDLIMKLLMAFQRADFQHAFDFKRGQGVQSLAASSMYVTELPAPRMPDDEPIPAN